MKKRYLREMESKEYSKFEGEETKNAGNLKISAEVTTENYAKRIPTMKSVVSS